ncbi:MAG: LacI family DNA-binding transcriptional regulator [Trueperaceae bacterium]|nr:LacI family DNA-binding transcriptional regulator [Trueperaceae bacterium]
MQDQNLDPNSPLPRYYQIYSAFLTMIQNGDLAVGDALPPERQIAEQFGVARPTVVKALDLLEHEGLIEKQQGRGNIVLERSSKLDNRTIAFVSSSNFTHELVMGISQTAFEHRFQLQMLGLDHDFKSLRDYLETCISNGVQGFIVYSRSGKKDLPIYHDLVARGIPLVLVDRYFPELECDWVVYNNEEASYMLTQNLIARGHQTIAVIPGFELETTAVTNRLKGYKRALEEAGIPYDEELLWLELYDNSVSPLNSVAKPNNLDLLRTRLECLKPTAILTINDMIADDVEHDLLYLQSSRMRSALKGIIEAEESQVSIELASFGTQLKSNYSYLKVFAVHPAFELGRQAASLLIRRLNHEYDKQNEKATQHLIIPMMIVDYAGSQQSLQRKEG